MTSAIIQPDAETPGIRVRPLLLMASALLLGFIMDHVLALPVLIPRDESLLHKAIPAALLVLGAVVSGAGIRNFMRAGTPVPGNRATHQLVTTGIHAWSRNPIYVGMLLLYLGVGVAVRSTWILAFTPLIIGILRYAVVRQEEAYLEGRFGDAYLDYKARVRRWL